MKRLDKAEASAARRASVAIVKWLLVPAVSDQEIESARNLFREYGASLGFSLCFQSFEEELARLPGKYAPPSGRLLLAREKENGDFIGCVALHKLEDSICEMKRLYVQPKYRGQRIGEALMEAVIREAQQIGYRRMRLDTVPSVMAKAVELYRARGFREIAPYTMNPVPGAIFMELML
jgi:ribosomal protein S18 acetylase RimI-like enzyme